MQLVKIIEEIIEIELLLKSLECAYTINNKTKEEKILWMNTNNQVEYLMYV